MTNRISSKELDALLKGTDQFALIDVREVGEYNSSHIPRASLIPRKQLEFDMAESVPFSGTQVVVCDDDGGPGSRQAFAMVHVDSDDHPHQRPNHKRMECEAKEWGHGHKLIM